MQETLGQGFFKELDGFGKDQLVNGSRVSFDDWSVFKDLSSKENYEEIIRAKEKKINELKGEIQRQQEIVAAKLKETEDTTARLSEQAECIGKIMEEFEKIKKSHWESNADELATFALALAEKMVLTAIKADPVLLTKQICLALESVRTTAPVEIRIAQEDLASIKASQDDNVKRLMENSRIKWIGDSRLAQGEIFLDTDQYRLDASMITVINNMKEHILFAPAGETGPT
ncbi:MAG: hypothetical protein HQM16_02385 [Deltaproteobacteria bacterium]|nr:hypothetical protein [Deltaproteobacteria bacterium]